MMENTILVAKYNELDGTSFQENRAPVVNETALK